MIYDKITELKTTLNFSLPIYLKENLIKLSQKKGENINKIIINALFTTHQELKSENTDVLRNILNKKIHNYACA